MSPSIHVVGANRTVTDDPTLAEVLRAGDILAEMLGILVAAQDRGGKISPHGIEGARGGILAWHRLRALASA